MIFVTGGAGFIGSNFVLDWLKEVGELVISFDKLTYVGNLNNFSLIEGEQHHLFVQGDICDSSQVSALWSKRKPCAIVHFAAEGHVACSSHGPDEFIRTNIKGAFNLLNAARACAGGCQAMKRRQSASFMSLRMKPTACLVRTSSLLPKAWPMHRVGPILPARLPVAT